MRKKFLSFMAATVAAATLFASGCGTTALSFNNAFTGGHDPVSAYKETLTYSVNYDDNYSSAMKKAASLDDLEFAFTDGEYVSEFRVESDTADVSSNLLATVSDKGVYRLTTAFVIHLSVTINGETYEHDDVIETTAYVASREYSFAPLYSYSAAEYLMIYKTNDGYALSLVKSEYSIVYDRNEYRTSYKVKGVDYTKESTVSLEETEAKTSTKKYDYRGLIDNAELLFALRGVQLEEKKSIDIPVISAAYDSATSLSVTNTGASAEKMTLKYNGTEYADENIAYNNLAFRVNDTNASGANQYFKVQSAKSEHVDNLALPVEYARPLIVYGNISTLGALVFRLTEVSITK